MLEVSEAVEVLLVEVVVVLLGEEIRINDPAATAITITITTTIATVREIPLFIPDESAFISTPIFKFQKSKQTTNQETTVELAR